LRQKTGAPLTLSGSDAAGRAEPYDALILAGGAARRLGGVDKPGLLVGGTSLLDRVLVAVAGAARVVVVGPRRTTPSSVFWCQEDPPGGGPVAALAAGLESVTADRVVLLAADLPFVTRAVVARLLEAADGRDGALAVDHNGRDQLLLGAWSTAALRRALPTKPAGARLGTAVAGLDAARVSLPTEPGEPFPWLDCDTADDLAVTRGMA
jgi:molybdopterin-guanine dinucleotide biosynthesis protein A